jgi:aconitate hydratase 2/2-methylisocitrate dehydratase
MVGRAVGLPSVNANQQGEGYYSVLGKSGARMEMPGCSLCMGKIPNLAEYMEQVKSLEAKAADVYRYMNFDQIAEFKEVADTVTM